MKKISFKKRITWGFSPVTRTVPSKKRYSRSKEKVTLSAVSKSDNL
ncbi:MAG: hypothetical protein KAH72_03955 [Flavobacteriaceae bacterium]|nr:hypothetical protein [Flavobacteriaceae bacterium]